MPVLLLLSATGAVYLFDREYNEAVYQEFYFVLPQTGPPLEPSHLRDSVTLREGETLLTHFPPAARDRSAAFTLLYDRNKIRNVYLNPYTGETLGSISSDERAMDLVKRLHTLEIFGVVGNRAVECAAGLAILLFLSGVYL